MRGIVWLTVLFAAAVVAALTLGRNDGLVSLFWGGWRADLSLNLFLLLLLGSCLLVFLALHALRGVLALPAKARAWRAEQRERSAQQLLREALMLLWGGRYGRAQAAVQRLQALRPGALGQKAEPGAATLAHLLGAEAAHRLQDRAQRQLQWEAAWAGAQAGDERDAVRLQAVAWAIDDRDAERALALLAELPPGTARRTLGLRLRLQAARLGGQPLEALRAARLLGKHQGFAPGVAQSLIRSLAMELLGAARDADQLRQAWSQLEAAERRDAFVVAWAAERFAQWGETAEARLCLRPLWDEAAQRSEDERRAIALALLRSLPGLGADWLPRLQAAQQACPRDAHLQLVMAHALAELQLWGKSLQLMRDVAEDSRLAANWRRRSWLRLAQLHAQSGDEVARIEALEAAARAD